MNPIVDILEIICEVLGCILFCVALFAIPFIIASALSNAL